MKKKFIRPQIECIKMGGETILSGSNSIGGTSQSHGVNNDDTGNDIMGYAKSSMLLQW